MKKTLPLIFIALLLVAGMQARAQTHEFAPIGAEWYYVNTPHLGNEFREYYRYYSEKDTVINAYSCKVINCHFHGEYTNYAKGIAILRQENDKIYHYFNGQFYLLYDFGVNIGDTLTIELKKSWIEDDLYEIMPVECVVNHIDFLRIDGEDLKMIYTDIISDLGGYLYIDDNHYNYIEKIGHPKVFMEKIHEEIHDTDYLRELRCYHDGENDYITPWWQEYNLPCDYPAFLPVENVSSENEILIYPNPVNDLLYIESIQPFTSQLFDINGRKICAKRGETTLNNMDLSSLSDGIYILQIKYDNGNINFHKIVKGGAK